MSDHSTESKSTLPLYSVYALLRITITIGIISTQFCLFNHYGLHADSYAYIKGITIIPWACKPIAAWILKQKQGILVGCIGIMFTGVIMIIPMKLWMFTLTLFMFEVFIVILDVHVDGWMLAFEQRSTTQIQSMLAKSIGSMIGSIGGAVLYHAVHNTIAFPVASLCAALIIAVYLGSAGSAGSAQTVSSAASSAPIPPAVEPYRAPFWIYTVILFLSPSFGAAILYYLTKEMHVTPIQFGVLGIIGSLGAVLAQGLYTVIKLPKRTSIVWGLTCDTIITAIVLMGISAGTRFVFPILCIQGIIAPIPDVFASMPVIIRAGEIVDTYKNKTLAYAIVTSLMNVCGIASTELGGIIVGIIGKKISLPLITGLLLVESSRAFIPMICVWML